MRIALRCGAPGFWKRRDRLDAARLTSFLFPFFLHPRTLKGRLADAVLPLSRHDGALRRTDPAHDKPSGAFGKNIV